ncbi:Sapep family Mn(2+)-dependent dipeptidase [Fusibacter sp. 3D3]|uniref:Sapep family Mn(2+)-dependent dipeptidase n=1 Tax=Fusibacter sp. 3D3 TaxID=1048380 RepID=UPI000858FF79|nr:Sapep family Mn(2+)-dependent dipeptidase [Fusibacter sp. 3D3]GAU78719.1 acetylornithine deacetylase/succinyl-diaminopimelate desuccinylase and related deacylases [Fusibacter sp. 3D3]
MKINEAVVTLKDPMIRDIIRLIKIPSIIEENQSEKPFGNAIDDALKCALQIAEELGFRTYYDPKGYYGYAEIGAGESLIGILGHLDVVPEGDHANWTYPPFEGVLKDNKLYGRGTQDDKGPLVAALYAVKALMDLQVDFNKRVRIIFGTDEENQWRGICRYMKEQEVPQFGFTPDSSFPVIFAEKGLLQIKLKSTKASPVTIRAGNALNTVPESAQIACNDYIKLEKTLKKNGFDYENDGDEIIVIGRNAHAAKPNLGINAITRLVLALKEMGLKSPGIDFLSDKIGLTNYGELIFGDCQDEVSGKLTINVGKIDFSKHGEVIGIDIRFPVTVSKTFIENAIMRVAEKYNLIYDEFDYLKPNYMEKEHPSVAKLTQVYIDETGLDGTPLSTGGATYARAMKNCVAFGAIFPGQERVAHQVDEYMDLDFLIKAAQIYAKSIKALLDED